MGKDKGKKKQEAKPVSAAKRSREALDAPSLPSPSKLLKHTPAPRKLASMVQGKQGEKGKEKQGQKKPGDWVREQFHVVGPKGKEKKHCKHCSKSLHGHNVTRMLQSEEVQSKEEQEEEGVVEIADDSEGSSKGGQGGDKGGEGDEAGEGDRAGKGDDDEEEEEEEDEEDEEEDEGEEEEESSISC